MVDLVDWMDGRRGSGGEGSLSARWDSPQLALPLLFLPRALFLVSDFLADLRVTVENSCHSSSPILPNRSPRRYPYQILIFSPPLFPTNQLGKKTHRLQGVNASSCKVLTVGLTVTRRPCLGVSLVANLSLWSCFFVLAIKETIPFTR